MYYSSEEKLEKLERLVEKQAFHIFLLQNIAANPAKYGLYNDVITTNISEKTFNALRRLTKDFEGRHAQDMPLMMSDFVHQFSRIALNDQPQLAADLSSFIPRWLGGVNGGFGFSKPLYKHFYE